MQAPSLQMLQVELQRRGGAPESRFAGEVLVRFSRFFTLLFGVFMGFLAILLSTAAQALQSVAAKLLMRAGSVGKPELFAMAALHAFAMLHRPSARVTSSRVMGMAKSKSPKIVKIFSA